MSRRLAARLALALFCACLAACSSFDRRWQNAAPPAARWEGRWTSAKHQSAGGRLRAVTEPAPDGRLATHFHANWLIFAGDYSVQLTPKPPGPRARGAQQFAGSHDLTKIFGGTYRYEAELTRETLTARYTSSYDHGTFDLRRVPFRKEIAPADARH